MTTNKDVFEALSSATRRDILELLRGGPLTVNDLTERVTVSQSAVSQHLRVMREAGLVRVERRGNQRVYDLDPQGLVALRRYVDAFWEGALAAYQAAADVIVKED